MNRPVDRSNSLTEAPRLPDLSNVEFGEKLQNLSRAGTLRVINMPSPPVDDPNKDKICTINDKKSDDYNFRGFKKDGSAIFTEVAVYDCRPRTPNDPAPLTPEQQAIVDEKIEEAGKKFDADIEKRFPKFKGEIKVSPTQIETGK
jgi:hypothetical protein